MATIGEYDMTTSRGCFWVATMGPDQMICGAGKTKREAIHNALEQIGGNGFTPVMFECIRCTAELYNAIDQRGAGGLRLELDEAGVVRLANANV